MNQHEISDQNLSHTLANYNVTRTEDISTKYLGTEALVYIGDDGGYCFFCCEVMVLDYVHEPFEEEKFCGGTPRDESFIVIVKKNGSDFDPLFEVRNYFTEDEWESTS